LKERAADPSDSNFDFTMSFNPRTDLDGEIGSDQHYQHYKAEYEMKQKTEQMKENIKEVITLQHVNVRAWL